MEMKPKRIPLGRNPLSDAPCRNPGMVLNKQGPGRHPRDVPCRDLGTMSSEQGPGHCILSGALHRRRGVVQNEQGSSHQSPRVRRVRKLVEPTRIRLGSWNVESLMGKLRELKWIQRLGGGYFHGKSRAATVVGLWHSGFFILTLCLEHNLLQLQNQQSCEVGSQARGELQNQQSCEVGPQARGESSKLLPSVKQNNTQKKKTH